MRVINARRKACSSFAQYQVQVQWAGQKLLPDAVTDFLHDSPFWSSFIPGIINQCRPDTAGQSTNDYYATVRSCSTRPTTPDLTAFHRSSSSSSGGGGGGRRATSGRDVATRCRGSSARRPSGRPRQNVTLVMAYNWTGKISTLRRLVCLRSRIGPRCNRQHAAAAEFLSRLQRQRRTAKDGKKESQTCCGRKTTPLRQTDGRTDGQAGGQL